MSDPDDVRARGSCPSPDALLALAEGRGAAASRLATLAHVGRCTRCWNELELLWATVVAARVPTADTAPRTLRP
jgi:hypothetical protein